MNDIVMEGVREYKERGLVSLVMSGQWELDNRYPEDRVCVQVELSDGYSVVDLLDLIAWLKANRPELLA